MKKNTLCDESDLIDFFAAETHSLYEAATKRQDSLNKKGDILIGVHLAILAALITFSKNDIQNTLWYVCLPILGIFISFFFSLKAFYPRTSLGKSAHIFKKKYLLKKTSSLLKRNSVAEIKKTLLCDKLEECVNLDEDSKEIKKSLQYSFWILIICSMIFLIEQFIFHAKIG